MFSLKNAFFITENPSEYLITSFDFKLGQASGVFKLRPEPIIGMKRLPNNEHVIAVGTRDAVLLVDTQNWKLIQR